MNNETAYKYMCILTYVCTCGRRMQKYRKMSIINENDTSYHSFII